MIRRVDSRRPAAFQVSADRAGPSVGSPSRFPGRRSRPATGRGDPGTPSRDKKGTRERKSPRRPPVLSAGSWQGFASSGWRSSFAARSEGGRSATGRSSGTSSKAASRAAMPACPASTRVRTGNERTSALAKAIPTARPSFCQSHRLQRHRLSSAGLLVRCSLLKFHIPRDINLAVLADCGAVAVH